MRTITGFKLTQKTIYTLLFSMILLALYLQKFYIEIGFGLKPFIFVLGIVISVHIIFKLKMIKGLLLYERLFLLFFFYSIIRGYFSLDKIMYFRLFLGFIIIFILYIFTTNIVYKIEVKTLMNVIYYISILFMLISLMLYFFGDTANGLGGEMDRGIYRLTGTTIDPNIFVVFISLIYGISLYKTIKKNKRYWISLILSIICVFLTFSRGGLLGIAFLTIAYFFKFKVMNLKLVIKSFCILCILIIICTFIAEFMEFNITKILQKRVSDSTGSGRIKIWKNGFNLFKDNPILGIGLYNFKTYNIKLHNDSHYLHNTFLAILVENGIIGGGLLLLSLSCFVLKKNNTNIEKIIKVVIYAQLFMFIFLSGIINEFLYFTFALYKGLIIKGNLNMEE